MSNFQYRKCDLVCKTQTAVFSFTTIQILAAVHQAVFASAWPSQYVDNKKGTGAIKIS
jgi:hypothetical protein